MVDTTRNRHARSLSRRAESGRYSGDGVPGGMRAAGAWAWRLLAVGAVVAVLVFLTVQLQLIVVALLVALLIAALLIPLVGRLAQWHIPHAVAIVVSLLVLVAIVTGLVYVVVWQLNAELDQLRDRSIESYQTVREWLRAEPFNVTDEQLNEWVAQTRKAIEQDSSVLVSGAVSVGSSIGHFLTGLLLTLFSLIVLLVDGKGVWRWIVRIMPRRARHALDHAGQVGWATLVNFVRVQVFVAFIDAVGIGIGAFFLNLPLVVPIAVLVFLGSFIPFVGSIVTGAVAVAVGLVYNGWLTALIMLIIVLVVHQLEGHVLQPLVMGNAVRVHPLAVVLGVAAGTLLAGIPGALFAVPIVAVLNTMVRDISSQHWRRSAEPAWLRAVARRAPTRRSDLAP